MSSRHHTTLLTLVGSYFQGHLLQARGASPHTVRSYRDTLRLLFAFIAERHHRTVADLSLDDLQSADVMDFLSHLEAKRANTASSRNIRLAAIRSLFKHLVEHDLSRAGQYQRVLAIPSKRVRVRPLSISSPRRSNTSSHNRIDRAPTGAAITPYFSSCTTPELASARRWACARSICRSTRHAMFAFSAKAVRSGSVLCGARLPRRCSGFWICAALNQGTGSSATTLGHASAAMVSPTSSRNTSRQLRMGCQPFDDVASRRTCFATVALSRYCKPASTSPLSETTWDTPASPRPVATSQRTCR